MLGSRKDSFLQDILILLYKGKWLGTVILSVHFMIDFFTSCRSEANEYFEVTWSSLFHQFIKWCPRRIHSLLRSVRVVALLSPHWASWKLPPGKVSWLKHSQGQHPHQTVTAAFSVLLWPSLHALPSPGHHQAPLPWEPQQSLRKTQSLPTHFYWLERHITTVHDSNIVQC